MRPPALPLLIPLLIALLAACATAPGTGRSQLTLVPDSVMNQMGAETYAATLAEAKIVTSGPDYEMVQRLGLRLSEAAKRLYPDPATSFEWQIVLIDEPGMVNAWALPGGKAAVYTGLLPVAQDEDSLAAVVGHEVAHALADHGNERVSQNLILTSGLTVAQILSGEMSEEDRALLMAGLGMGAQVGVLLPYSRGHESEADELGLYLSADAGYDPRAAVGLWERMAAMGGERPPELLSTHPSEASRITHLQELMAEALVLYEAAQVAGR